MPGVFAHGDFDTWSPGYLMFIAAMHNGISRLYETFGNGGAETLERTLDPREYERTWYRQNPPLPNAMWSQRDNNNYEETGLADLAALLRRNNRHLFLKNFYLKTKRSIEKPKRRRARGICVAADDPRPGSQADLLRVMQKQDVEISRATAALTRDAARSKTRPRNVRQDGGQIQDSRREGRGKSAARRRRRKNFPPEATSFAWTSHIRASRTRCWIISIGVRTIRRRLLTTIPAGRLANSSTCKSCA